MWNEIFQANLKAFAADSPKIVDRAIKINEEFGAWAKYHNPNDISTLEEKDEILIQVLGEDLQDLKLRAWYYVYKGKKVLKDEDKMLCVYFAQLCDNHFWMILNLRYKLWGIPNLAIRDGWKIVKIKYDHQMPEALKRILGLE